MRRINYTIVIVIAALTLFLMASCAPDQGKSSGQEEDKANVGVKLPQNQKLALSADIKVTLDVAGTGLSCTLTYNPGPPERYECSIPNVPPDIYTFSIIYEHSIYNATLLTLSKEFEVKEGKNTIDFTQPPVTEDKNFHNDNDNLNNFDEFMTYNTDPTEDDTDGDGMDDGWEIQYGLNPTSPLDANGNLDGDALSNLEEYQNGKNPTIPDSQCNDGKDNDLDSLADAADPGCVSSVDVAETEAGHICDDGIDNDSDGKTDYSGGDPGCADVNDGDERQACNDGLDNDGDSKIDLNDPGCASALDITESSSTIECDDGVDNDGDGKIDYPADLGCVSRADTTELASSLECHNGIDDDGDGLTDYPADLECTNYNGFEYIVKVVAGNYHTCALTSIGSVKCWGANGAGAVGDFTTTDRYKPVDVVGLTSGVIDISAGTGHTCAVTDSGAVKCWGYNDKGQLGDGTYGNGYYREVPVDVEGIFTGAVEVAAGEHHTCARLENGMVKCWGENTYGQLGDNMNCGNTVCPTPVVVAFFFPTTFASAIGAGGAHGCAVTTVSSREIRCWGDNSLGQLGTGVWNAGNNAYVSQDFADTPVSGLVNATDVTTAFFHSCALTTSGAVRCWGLNIHGELGNNYTGNCKLGLSHWCNDVPTEPTGLSSGVRKIASGYSHNCAVTSDNHVACWGVNNTYQCGLNCNQTCDFWFDLQAPACCKTPGVVPWLAQVYDIGTGGSHTCAITTTGSLYCWGANNKGQLGNNNSCTDTCTYTTSLPANTYTVSCCKTPSVVQWR